MTVDRVILADDHPLLLRGLADLVSQEADFAVVGVASSGREAMSLLTLTRPDIAILDVSMPDLGGLAILRKVMEAGMAIRVVFLTATITPAQISEALSLGVWGLLLKESAPDALIDCLRSVAAGDRWLPEALLSSAIPDWAGPVVPFADLTRREREVVDLVCRGLSNRAIAASVGTTEGTVKIHLHNIFQKLKVTNRTSLAALNFDFAERN